LPESVLSPPADRLVEGHSWQSLNLINIILKQKTMPSYYNKKLVISGNILEFYEYGDSVTVGEKKQSKPRGKKTNRPENRKLSFRASKRNLKRIVNTNSETWTDDNNNYVFPKFITLTFAKNIQDIPSANLEYKKFLQRLNYYFTNKKENFLKYAVVIEFQKRGAIHYHAVFFNLPYISNKKLSQIWSNGFVRINKINYVYNIGSYMTKYMAKDLDDTRLCGEKSYFTSRGLKKPISTYSEYEIRVLRKIMPEDVKPFTFDFKTEYTGESKYIQYNLKDHPRLKNAILLLMNEDENTDSTL